MLYSPTVAAYLKQYWMGKFSLWCHGVVNLVEDAMSMQIEANNQFSEALMKNVKYNQDMQSHLSKPADYILHRYEDLDKSTKQFIHQYETVHGQIQELLKRRAKRRWGNDNTDGTSSTSLVMLTQDELTQQAEESTTESWQRCGRAPEFESNLRRDLEFVFHEKIDGRMNFTQKHKYLQDIIGNQISYPTLKDFMENKTSYRTGLAPKHRRALANFVEMHRQELTDMSVKQAASL
jgi:hypothetical protein